MERSRWVVILVDALALGWMVPASAAEPQCLYTKHSRPGKVPHGTQLWGLVLLLVVLGINLPGSLSSAFASPIILDSTNSYSVEIEPGASLSQPDFTSGFNFIAGTGVEFAIGDSTNAVFPGISQIGSGSLLDGNRPIDLVQGSVPFTILVTSNNNLYDANLVYFFSFQSGGIGVAPIPDSAAGAVFDLQGPVGLTPIPEPATLLLFGTAAIGLGLARWRRHRDR